MSLITFAFICIGITNYLTIHGHYMVPPSIYDFFPILTLEVLSACKATIPFAVLVHEKSRGLKRDWKIRFERGHSFFVSHKIFMKWSKAVNALKCNFSCNSFRIFSMNKSTQNRFYAGELDFTINLLLALSKKNVGGSVSFKVKLKSNVIGIYKLLYKKKSVNLTKLNFWVWLRIDWCFFPSSSFYISQ
jgi:hypothetical protein